MCVRITCYAFDSSVSESPSAQLTFRVIFIVFCEGFTRRPVVPYDVPHFVWTRIAPYSKGARFKPVIVFVIANGVIYIGHILFGFVFVPPTLRHRRTVAR